MIGTAGERGTNQKSREQYAAALKAASYTDARETVLLGLGADVQRSGNTFGKVVLPLVKHVAVQLIMGTAGHGRLFLDAR